MENRYEEIRTWLRRNNCYQKLAIIIASLTWFSCGLLASWASPFMMKISKDKENYKISEEDCLNFSTVPPIAMMITVPLFSKLCDIIGRKPVLLLSAIPQFQAWMIKAIAKDLHHFYIARTLVGVGDGILLAATPMYIGEIASPSIRGTWGIAPVLGLYIGELVITILGSYLSVEVTSFACGPIPILFILLFSFMPESPYYLVIARREEEAKTVLRKLTGKQNIEKDYHEIEASISRQMSEESTWKALFVIDSNRRALAAGVFLRLSQMLGGATVFLNYTQYIFLKSGGNVGPEVSSIIYMALWLIFSLGMSHFVEGFGRRKAYMGSLASCSLVLLLESIYFYVDATSFRWFPLVGMVSYIVFASFGLSTIPALMTGELFSASIKAKAVSVLVILFGLMSYLSCKIFSFLNSRCGFYAPFLFFSCCTLLSTVLAYYILPETKGKTLEEVQRCLKSDATKEIEKEHLVVTEGYEI